MTFIMGTPTDLLECDIPPTYILANVQADPSKESQALQRAHKLFMRGRPWGEVVAGLLPQFELALMSLHDAAILRERGPMTLIFEGPIADCLINQRSDFLDHPGFSAVKKMALDALDELNAVRVQGADDAMKRMEKGTRGDVFFW